VAIGQYVQTATGALRVLGPTGRDQVIDAFAKKGNVSTAIAYLRSQFPKLRKADAGAVVGQILADFAPRGQRVSAAAERPISQSSHTVQPTNITDYRYRVAVGFSNPATGEISYLTVYIGSGVPLSPNQIKRLAEEKFNAAVAESSATGISGSGGSADSEFVSAAIVAAESKF